MENMTVVFFYVDKGKNGWKRCGWRDRVRKRFRRKQHIEENNWEYHVRRGTVMKQGGRQVTLRWMKVFLPEHERKGKEWTTEGWRQYLNGLPVPEESRTVYYLPDAEAGRMLGRSAEPLSLEWILLFVEYYGLQFDGLVILQDREMDAGELVYLFAQKTKYLGVVTAEPEAWQEMAEELTEEYGFLLDVAERVGKLHLGRGRLLFVAGARLFGAAPSAIPPGSIWIDTDVQGETGRKLCSAAGGVRYIGIKSFLREMFATTA